MNQKLLPIILDNKDRAKQLALNEYLTTDKEHSLELLRGLNHEIQRLDNHIADLIKESDDMKERKKQIEHKLGKLGVNMEKMQEATEELKIPYCHTTEREEQDKEEELKRKAAEEAEERKSKKAKVIPLVKGIVAPEMMHEDITVEEEKEEDYESKIKRQQKEIIRKQEILLQTAESQLMTAQQTKATQERMLKEQEYMKRE